MGIIKYRNHNPRKQGSKAIPRDHRKATAKFNSVTDPAKNMANEMKLLKSQLPRLLEKYKKNPKNQPKFFVSSSSPMEGGKTSLYINKRKWRGKGKKRRIGVKAKQMSVVVAKRKRASRSVFEIVSARATNKSGAVR